MPSTKQFESLKLTIPFQVEYLDMYQLTEIINHHIRTTLEYIDTGKIASFEIPLEEALYKIKKVDKTILIKRYDQDGVIELDPQGIDFINWLYTKAPYISMVGYERGQF